MVATWTEAFSSFAPAGTGWQNYDIFTNKSVPKGAIAYIVIGSVNDAAARTVGVRTDGSALNRYVKLHESEAGGACTADFYVKVDASTGLIETYADNVTGITFYLIGYWTGTTFTELFASISPTVASTWTDRDVFTNQAVPKGSVCQVMCNNRQDAAAATMGCRTDGSGLSRYFVIHEAESATVETTDVTSFTMCVKSDVSTGLIEVYASNLTSDVLLLGYFDSKLNYVENFQTGSVSATGWTDWDLTAYLDADGRVVEVVCGNANTGVEYNFGCRKNGSALARYILVHESETNGVNGFTAPTETDASGIVELYASDAASEYFRYVGYYKPTEKDVIEVEGIALSDVAWTNQIKILESILLTDVAIQALPPWTYGSDGPYTVASPTITPVPISRSMHRRIWRSRGYWWLHLVNAANSTSVFSSTNKTSWTERAALSNSGDFTSDGRSLSANYVGVDGAYSNYTVWLMGYVGQDAGDPIVKYRRAICNSDGTLSLDTQVGNVFYATAAYCEYATWPYLRKTNYPSIIRDNNYAGTDQFEIDHLNTASGSAGTYDYFGTKSSRDAFVLAFPYGTSSNTSIVIYCSSAAGYALYWDLLAGTNGDTWTSEQTLASDMSEKWAWNAAKRFDSDVVMIVYVRTNGSNYDIKFRRWDPSGGMGSEESVVSGITSLPDVTVAMDEDSDEAYVLWRAGTTIYAKRRTAASTWSGTDTVLSGLAATAQAFNAAEVAFSAVLAMSWLEGTAGSWTVKAAFVQVGAIIVSQTATDTVTLADAIRKSPEAMVVADAAALLEFSLIHDAVPYTYPWCDVSDTAAEGGCAYQNHVFRTREKYERAYIFYQDDRYAKMSSETRFLEALYPMSNYVLLEDFGAGLSEDKDDDVHWDRASLVFRWAWRSGANIILRTLTPNQTSPTWVTVGGTSTAYTSAGTMDRVSVCVSDSSYWLAFLETSGGSYKYPKFINSVSWPTGWNGVTVIDSTYGNASAIRILPAGGSLTTAFLWVTGSAAGSYSIRAKYYNAGLGNIGEICSDLWDPNAWSANTDEQGNIYVVWLSGASGTTLKIIKVAGTTIGTPLTLTSVNNDMANSRCHVSVDRTQDRQVVFWTTSVVSGSCYLFAQLMAGGAPVGTAVALDYRTGGNSYAFMGGEANTGTHDVWVLYRNVQGGGDTDLRLARFAGIVQQITSDSLGNIVETVIQSSFVIEKLIEDALGLSDADYRGKAAIEADAIALVDLIYKGMAPGIAADAVGLSDVDRAGKGLVELDSIGVADVINVIYALINKFVTDGIAVADADLAGKSLVEAVATLLTDAVLAGKGLLQTDGVAIADAKFAGKGLVENDGATLSDSKFVFKGLVETDVIALAETILKGWAPSILESLGLSDAGRFDKSLLAADSTGVSDQVAKTRFLFVADGVGVSEGAPTDRQDLVVDSAAVSDSVFGHLGRVVQDALALGDLKLVNKTAFVADTFSLLEALLMAKDVLARDDIAALDAIVALKGLRIAEAMALDDAARIGKDTVALEGISVADSMTRDRALVILESSGLFDAELVPARALPISDDLLLAAELLVIGKELSVADGATLNEAIVRVVTGVAALRRLRAELAASRSLSGQSDTGMDGQAMKNPDPLDGETDAGRELDADEDKTRLRKGLKE